MSIYGLYFAIKYFIIWLWRELKEKLYCFYHQKSCFEICRMDFDYSNCILYYKEIETLLKN